MSKAPHIQLTVRNAEASAGFYDQFTGLFAMRPQPQDGAHYWSGRGAAISIIDGKVCFRTMTGEDVDRAYELARKLSAKIAHPPQTGHWGPGSYSVALDDPDGIRLEVICVTGKDIEDGSPKIAVVLVGDTRIL